MHIVNLPDRTRALSIFVSLRRPIPIVRGGARTVQAKATG